MSGKLFLESILIAIITRTFICFNEEAEALTSSVEVPAIKVINVLPDERLVVEAAVAVPLDGDVPGTLAELPEEVAVPFIDDVPVTLLPEALPENRDD